MKNKYYLYVLTDTSLEFNKETEYGVIKNKPFYVGKGSNLNNYNKRFLIHIRQAKNKANINPHKERKILKLLESNSLGYEELMRSDVDLGIEEINLIKLLGRECCDENGIITNISEGGTGGYVWKDNPIAIENIRKANEKKWSGENNPNSKENRDINATPSRLSKLSGKHWNKGKFRSKYSIYDVFEKRFIEEGISIQKAREICGVSCGSHYEIHKNKYLLINDLKNSFLFYKKKLNILSEHGIVRSTCIYLKETDKYVEISRNDLSIIDVGSII